LVAILERHCKLKFFLLILTIFTSCTTHTKKQTDNSNQPNQPEKKYTKIISDSTNKLTEKIENLEVEYTVWGCACPQWIQTKDLELKDTTIKFIDLHFYIEPANRELDLPIYFDAFRHRLKLEGQFYEKKDYPKGTVEMEEPMSKAKVFRYTKIEVIDRPNFKPQSKIETLTLDYNAIACTCAQWSEAKYSSNPDKRVYYWLEPLNEKLIQADTLYNGENLPVQIKVTGQIVSENGFPKRDLSKVGQNEAGKVFRYTKIEVLKNGQKKNGYQH
jgi:hypothetical protein